MKTFLQGFILIIPHPSFSRHRMIIIAEQMQDAVNDQPQQLLAQTHAISFGIALRDRHANGNGGHSPSLRCRAKIEGDDISFRSLLQKIAVQRADFFFIDKIHFEIEGGCRVLAPKLI